MMSFMWPNLRSECDMFIVPSLGTFKVELKLFQFQLKDFSAQGHRRVTARDITLLSLSIWFS